MASMSILDDAIREHLELKRAHGADESEIKKLEDEAFGPPSRPEGPDSFAEAPTEFIEQSETPEAPASDPEGGRRINVADLQEPPPSEEPGAEAAETVEPQAETPLRPAEDPAQAAPPAEEEPAAVEAIDADRGAAEAADAPQGTDERHAIAEQPTEFFDVEAEMGTEDAPAPPTEAPSPSDEEIVAAEAAEPKLAPVEPPTEIYAARTEAPADADAEEEDEDFWSEQRLSDELDQALEAPPADPVEPPAPAEPAEPAAPKDSEPPSAEGEQPQQQTNYDPDTGHEDVLEDTPEFLEESPEDDELWFEQRPPKDFDFDD
jgi:hypothetical protein